MRRRLAITIAVVTASALATAGILVERARRPSPPASIGEAVRAFRAAPGDLHGTPAPGVYDYALRGRECAGLGPLRLCRELPAHAALIVTRHGSTVTDELRLSADHVEAQRYVERANGRYLIWQRAFVRFAGIGQDDATATTPATLALPRSPRVGQRWTQRFRAGSLPVAGSNVVRAVAEVRVGNLLVPTLEIDSISTTGGAHPGTERDVSLHAVAWGLDVRLDVDRRIGGTFPYTLVAHAVLLRLEPLR